MVSETVLKLKEEDTDQLGYNSAAGVLVTDQFTEEREESERDLESALLEECQVMIERELQEQENDNADGNDRQGMLPSAKIFIPEINGHMYKVKVVTELCTHGKVSSDRLI